MRSLFNKNHMPMNHRQHASMLLLLSLLMTSTRAAIECPVGFGSTAMQVIADDRINDNFCDCPTNGADEPATNACAGLEYWPGHAADANNDAPSSQLLYTCPQQPDLQISVSKLRDGICDCCDGADEVPGTCPDHCEELLAAERDRRAKAKAAFDVGYAKRQTAIAEFAQLRQKVQVQTQEKETELERLGMELEQATQKVDDWKLQYASSRLAHVESVSIAVALTTQSSSASTVSGLLDGLTDVELADFIIHACQVAGEMEGADDIKTCAPLRLAGLDAGLRWEPNIYDLSVLRESDDGMKELANLFHHNLKQEKKTWNSKQANKKPHGRRLMREQDDDAYMTDDIYHDSDDEDEDDVADRLHREMEEQRRSRQDKSASGAKTAQEEDDEGGVNREELIRALREAPFSRSRVLFLAHSKDMLDLIEQMTKKDEENEETNADSESEAVSDEEKITENEQTTPDFDPEKVPAVKSKLEELVQRIERGINYGVSAKVLMDALNAYEFENAETKRKFLYILAIGTLHHGKLSSVQVWHVLRAVVAELSDDSVADEAETCSLPYASACPPKSVERKAGAASVKLPHGTILRAAEEFCNHQQSTSVSQVCAAKDSIPSDLPDGYMGYYGVGPREDSDVLTDAFASLALRLDEATDKELKELEDKVDAIRKDTKATEATIADLNASVGGDNPDKFGPDGELHSIKDSCFSITTGKYTYELCMFVNAKQKEGSGAGGTDLGKWSEAGVDEATGQRVWTWDKGAKCWNGPQRSATVYVTCGKDTTILSADEPETCKYEFQVESPVACDETFRLQHQLE